MDCSSAREWMATAVAEELEPTEPLRAHLAECSSCQAEFDVWRQSWALLGAWADAEPPARLDRAVLSEVRAQTEASRSWVRRFKSGRVWAAAAAAAFLAVAASLFVPYQESLRVCGKVLSDAGLVLPALTLSFLVGLPYAFLPVLGVVLFWVYVKGNGRKMQGLKVGPAFAVLMVPYIIFACVDLEASVIVGILLGTVTGGLLAGAVTQWVTGQRPAGAPA